MSSDSADRAPTTEPALQRRKRQHVGSDGYGLRAAIACRACRERKTRCSGHQPTCAYCLKAGVPCEYVSNLPTCTAAPWTTLTRASAPASAPTFDVWGEKILTAIDSLARDLHASHLHRGLPPGSGFGGVDASSTLPAVVSGQPSAILPAAGDEFSKSIPIAGPSPIASLPSILAWTVFSEREDVLPRFPSKRSEHARRSTALQTSGKESASCATSDLLGLVDCFDSTFPDQYRVVDRDELRRCVAHIGEFGLQWNTESCLVLLVAALASLSLGRTAVGLTANALRYWNMAKKRLAWALEDSSLVAAQCQFLAGLWYLYIADPASSWKMFNCALLAVDAITVRHPHEPTTTHVRRPSDEPFKETIRWVCVHFLCQLRCEEEFSISLSTYNPPDSDFVSRSPYWPALASLLQIREGALIDCRALHTDMSLNDIATLHAQIAVAQRALNDWYARLPASLRFCMSDEQMDLGTDCTGHNGNKRLLSSCYFETEELVLRPALYVLLHADCFRQFRAASLDSFVPASPSDANALQDVLGSYYAEAFCGMSRRHRTLLLVQLGALLKVDTSRQASMNIGWFAEQGRVTLALLLIAAEHGFSREAFHKTFPAGSFPPTTEMLDNIETSLRRDSIGGSGIVGSGRVHADLLHDLRVSH